MNDYNEAIKNLQTIHGMPLTIRMAIEALKKQIPKKRKKFEDNYKSFSFDCPECGGYLVSEIDGELCAGQRYKYCHRCGQAIDWSDDE